MKKGEEAMEILEAYDLTGTLRGAAALAGCDHKTVARLVAARKAAGGGLPERARQRPLVDPFAEKIDELVDRSRALVRADVVHGVLVAMGYEGSYRTTRRAVAEAKRRWRNKHGRRTRPWIPQPGLWLQFDYGDGPEVAGSRAPCFVRLALDARGGPNARACPRFLQRRAGGGAGLADSPQVVGHSALRPRRHAACRGHLRLG